MQILGGHDANDPYFDGAAFANPPAGVLGSTGQESRLIGPGFFQMNASISRTFPIKEEKLKFQLVGEAYNLTNTVVFANPGGSCCWSTTAKRRHHYNGFGVISGTQSTPRIWRWPDICGSNPRRKEPAGERLGEKALGQHRLPGRKMMRAEALARE